VQRPVINNNIFFVKKKQPEVVANKTTTAKPKPQLQIAPNQYRVCRSNVSNNNNNNLKLQLTKPPLQNQIQHPSYKTSTTKPTCDENRSTRTIESEPQKQCNITATPQST
jgi:hypothetical protein